ncbi:toll/interleukin-1 receptor domain-containing protein [Planctomycetota bacterium]
MSVFLAHSSGDKDYVREVHRLLAIDGFQPWLDEVDLVGGQDWELEIQNAIDKADAVVLFLSAHAVDSKGYLQKEIALALDVAQRQPEGSILLIPMRLDNHDLPRRLRHLHAIRCAPDNWMPVAPKDGWALDWLSSVWDALQEFSIGDGYIQLQRALLASAGHHRWPSMPSRFESYQFEGSSVDYVVRGQRPDGERYYGTASIRLLDPNSECDRMVHMATRVEMETFEYHGRLQGSLLEFSGPHRVTYCWTRYNDLLVGSWNELGFEELMPAARAHDTSS